MITINDNDLPITVAEKIIKGTKPHNPTPLTKAVTKVIAGNKNDANEIDMFDLIIVIVPGKAKDGISYDRLTEGMKKEVNHAIERGMRPKFIWANELWKVMID